MGSPVPGELYRSIAQRAIDAIRRHCPTHYVIADGNNAGSKITPELIGLDLAQSKHAYFPLQIAFHQAPWHWKDPTKCPPIVYPGIAAGRTYGRLQLEDHYRPWIELVRQGVGVHAGECGCWNKTPHPLFLAWFEDTLDILKSNGIGFALWNFRGDFGVLDSGRSDVSYADWHGHKLDGKLLDLLRRY